MKSPADFLERLRAGITSSSAEQTVALGAAAATHLPGNQVLALHGDLGAGKTTLVRGIARGWRVQEPVTSPTFNLFTIYSGSRQLVHLDAYRLGSGSDMDGLMIEDFLQEPWCIAIEWPENVADWIPSTAWHIRLGINGDGHHHIRLESP